MTNADYTAELEILLSAYVQISQRETPIAESVAAAALGLGTAEFRERARAAAQRGRRRVVEALPFGGEWRAS